MTKNADIEIITGSEFMVSQASSLTDAGEEFLDGWTPREDPAALIVVDLGVIIIPDRLLDDLRRDIRNAGLGIAETQAKV